MDSPTQIGMVVALPGNAASCSTGSRLGVYASRNTEARSPSGLGPRTLGSRITPSGEHTALGTEVELKLPRVDVL
jgi:hypothetical protein